MAAGESLVETFALATTCRHVTIHITTERPVEFVDVTPELEALIAQIGIDVGFINVQSLHTTTSIVVNEHEPQLLADFTELLERAAPSGASYRHDDVRLRTVNVIAGERINGHSHCQALLLASSVCLNIAGGCLQLGRWQRVFIAELDGPQTRDLSILIFGTSAQAHCEPSLRARSPLAR
jgi:secondary thiamine-phosphate synthase enzyme